MATPYKMKGYSYPGTSPLKKENEKKVEVTTVYNEDGSYTKSGGGKSTIYKPNPKYDPKGKPGRNYKFVTGKKNPDGSDVGE
tara:strand:+ start:269 stop:514 length:246 start_codon:yes stop_codon:yes gene_type:complete